MIGKTLAHYEITALLGEGGMGAVYRATDTKLGREVALKVLTGLADHGSERLARFQQEARTIAALNHPNIVTLHSVEEADGVPFLTMELVDGVRLTTRISEDGLALDDLLTFAVPMADAVSAAHKQGITHRDLKPDNVMLDADGRVKVLDFGLAKLLEADGAHEDATRTIAMHKTAEGRILGTAAYMAPEQAEGKPVDARSDVFSLGIVLYEMATGRKPFDGETAISTISSIVKEQPRSALEINRALPRHLGRILDRCLAKDPDRRYQSALELRNELELLDRESKSGELEMWVPAGTTGAPRSGRPGVPVAAFVAGLVIVAVATYFGTRALDRAPATSDVPRLAQVEPLTTQGKQASYPSLSPSGDLFVYQARDGGDEDIFLQRIGGQRPINLTPDHEGPDRRPALSPDGQRIAFESARGGGGIYVMGTTGERVRRVSTQGHDPAWSPDGTHIAYTTSPWNDPSSRNTGGRLFVIPADGGTPRPVTPDTMDAVQPDWSPDGLRIVFWSVAAPNGQRDIHSIGADGTGLVQLTADPSLDFTPRFGPDGRSVWFASNRTGTFNLWRLEVDPVTGAARGAPEPVTLPNDWVDRFDVKGDRIAFAAPDVSSRAVRIDLPTVPGDLATARPLTSDTLHVVHVSLSPGGQRFVFNTPIGTGFQDLYVVAADGSSIDRITDDAFRDRGAAWHPGGERIVFYSDRSGAYEIWTMRADGSDPRRISDLMNDGRDTQWFPRFSSDGSMVAAFNESGTTLWDVDPETGRLGSPRSIEAPGGLPFFVASSWHPRRNIVAGWSGQLADDQGMQSLWLHDVDTDDWTLLVEALDRHWISGTFSSTGDIFYVVRPPDHIVALESAAAPYAGLDDPRIRTVAEGTRSTSLSASPDGTWLLANHIERNAEIWGATIATAGSSEKE